MTRPFLQIIFSISLVIFMVGNLSTMGLQLRMADACAPLKNLRFVMVTLIGGFVIGPALGYLVVRIVPMEPPYASAVLLLGMAPAAPFLPLVAKRANGDLAAAAALMLLACVGTILIMPLGLPLVAPGLSASAWTIAKPLLTLVLLPLAAGILIKSRWERAAARIYACVKPITAVGTIVFLLLALILNITGFIKAMGSGALLSQLIYVPALSLAGHFMAAGMPPNKRSVMSLGMCTRNIGAAAAIVGPDGDQRILLMLVIATFVTVAFSFAVAPWFARKAQPRAEPARAETHV